MFSLGRADVFAPVDLALQEAVRLLFDLEARPKPKELRLMSEAWSPWRAVAARLMGLLQSCKAARGHSMTRVLQSERKEPVSGTTRSVVVFLHGYGANGADLLGLADPLGEHVRHAVHSA